jgi:hypothetical protein
VLRFSLVGLCIFLWLNIPPEMADMTTLNRRSVKPDAQIAVMKARQAAALASDDGPIFSTVAKLVEALKRSIPEGTQNAELKHEALRLGRELLRRTKYEEQR